MVVSTFFVTASWLREGEEELADQKQKDEFRATGRSTGELNDWGFQLDADSLDIHLPSIHSWRRCCPRG